MLQARDVRVVLGDAEVLRRVSLAVAPGQVVAVVGPNGAGKSTLLNVLSGSLRPHAGSVCMEDYPLATWTPRALARRRAVLPQHQELSFAFRALEVVLLGRLPHFDASSPETDLEVARACLAVTEAEHLAERIYTTLSGGERQRVQLARVLAQIHCTDSEQDLAGRYLLLDEPTSCHGHAQQHAIIEVARRAAERGAGAVVILHDLDLAARYGDRIVVLAGGRVLSEGAPEKVLTELTVRRAFGLSASVTPLPPRGASGNAQDPFFAVGRVTSKRRGVRSPPPGMGWGLPVPRR